MQFDLQADGSRSPLPAPSVDTGAGLERIASVMQGVPSNFDTDLFTPIIERAVEVVGRDYDRGPSGAPFRVLADHARAVAFLLADGVFPSSDGRGYVLRRILRRAVRYGWLLGQREPTLVHLTHRVVDVMRGVYPELEEKRAHIERTTRAEEERFLETIEGGLKRLDELKGASVITGDEAFKLYDTYGFPLDLTQLIAAERGQTVDGRSAVVGSLGDHFEPTPAEAVVNEARRRNIERNHTATHLVHAALRKILGAHVRQMGSVVAPDRLRFDFAHHGPVGDDELAAVEEEVNAHIWENLPIETREMKYKEASAAGAMAVVTKIGDVELHVQDGDFDDRDQIGLLVDAFRAKHKSAILVLLTKGGRPGLHVAVTDDLVLRGLKAGELAGDLAALVGGKGGGRPHFASAGVGDVAKLPLIKSSVADVVRKRLGG